MYCFMQQIEEVVLHNKMYFLRLKCYLGSWGASSTVSLVSVVME